MLPDAAHLDELLAFVRAWDRASPMLIHCFAGVSRSTAAAYIAACALAPERDEFAIARALRAASPTASPNTHLVAAGRGSGHLLTVLFQHGTRLAGIKTQIFSRVFFATSSLLSKPSMQAKSRAPGVSIPR